MTSPKPLTLTELRFKITIFLILLMTLTGFLAMDIFAPSLPAIAQNFLVPAGRAQLAIATYLGGFGFSQLLYGPLSDYYGRRPILIIGFTIFLIGSIVCITAPTIFILLLGRFIQGIGIGAGAALSRVILRDLLVDAKMAQIASYLTAIIALTTALSPGIGGFIQHYYGYQGNLWIMLVFSIIVLLLILILLPETNVSLLTKPKKISHFLKNYFEILNNKIFILNVICAGAALSVLIAYVTINPFLLQGTFELSPDMYGLLTILIELGELVGTMINARYVNQLGTRKMIGLGLGIIFVAGMGLVSINSINQLTLLLIIVLNFFANIGIAFILPNTAAQAFSLFNKKIGFVGALYGFQQILVTALTIHIVAFLQLQSQKNLGYIFIFLASLSVIVGVRVSSASQNIVSSGKDDSITMYH